MNAPAVLELVWHSALTPAVAAFVAFFALGLVRPADAVRRYRPPIAFAVGVFVAFLLLPSTTSLVPSRYWEWIPWLSLLSAFIAGLIRADGVVRGERWLAVYLFFLGAAMLIVPTWQQLWPARAIQVAVMSVAMTVVSTLLVPLPGRLSGTLFAFWLMVAAAATSALILSEQSESIGRPAALPAGALAGCIAAALIVRAPVDWSGLASPYALVAGGYAYLGAVYPTTPLWPLLIVPISPLGLWLCSIRLGHWSPLPGVWSFLPQAICVLTPIIIVAVLLISRSAGGNNW